MYTEADLLEEFSENQLQNARKIIRQNKVLELKPDLQKGTLRGKVRGSHGETYRLEVMLSASRQGEVEIFGDCTCPVGYNCKHVAALMLYGLQTGTVVAQPGATLPPVPPNFAALKLEVLKAAGLIQAASGLPVPAVSRVASAVAGRNGSDLPADLELWLSNTVVSTPPLNQKPKGPAYELLFGLTVAAGRPAVTAFGAQLNKSGGFKVSKTWTLDAELRNVPEYVQRDETLLRLLLACRETGPMVGGAIRLRDTPLSVEALERLLETGRVYWEHPDSGVKLRLGAARTGTPRWVFDANGVQHPGFQISPSAAELLPFQHPWYADLEQGEVGPLEISLAPSLLRSFLSAPAVRPQAAAGLARALEARGLKLPVPSQVQLQRVAAPCTPVLRLYSENPPLAQYGRLFEFQHTLELSFDYGGRRLGFEASLNSRDNLSEYRNGVLLEVERDLRTEKAASKTLTELNLRPLDGFTVAYNIPPKLRGRWGGRLSDAAWLEFTTQVAPKLRAKGWTVEFDPSFAFNVIEAGELYGDLQEGESGWFGLELGVTVDGLRVSLIPLLIELLRRFPSEYALENLQHLPDSQRIYPRLPDGRALALELGRVKPILSVLLELYMTERSSDTVRLSILDAARLAELEGLVKLRWFGGERLLDLGRKLRDFSGIAPLEPPEKLTATLRPYQLQGVAWLQFMREYELGGILADDMGLGKTVQTLTHLQLEVDAGRARQPSLVVAPTSVIGNWRSESARFTPDLRVLVLHGAHRKEDFERLNDFDLIVTTYPLIQRDLETLRAQPFHLLILDEAQNIKNSRSATAKAVLGLKAQHRLCLTGTPLENHLGELWSIMHFLMPGFLGDETSFKKLYRNPIEKHGDLDRRTHLANRLRPFLLRRTKQLVASELPEKTQTIVRVELEDSQRDLYETLRTSVHERVREEIAAKGLARSQIMILDALLKLRQACCDPRLVKLSAARNVQGNAKLEWLLETLPAMLEEGRKVLLFSSFASLLALLEPELKTLGVKYSLLTGETKDRAAQIDAFQNGETSVFLITLKAGGVGLNLTAADTVVHYDPWWNPAAENQATDRAHRIGQTKAVFVYKLIAAGSLEERILELQDRKAELAKGILEGSLSSATALTQTDVTWLLAPLELTAGDSPKEQIKPKLLSP